MIKFNKLNNMERKIPSAHKHELRQLSLGFGNINQKEYCNCDDCIELRKRRDSIFNKWYHRIKRWYNNL